MILYPADKCVMGNNQLAEQGTAFYATLKHGSVTITRLCNIDSVYQLFLLQGEAREADLYTPDCMVNVTIQ